MRKFYARLALMGLGLFMLDLASTWVLGLLYSPKVLSDRYPELTTAQWSELMDSPTMKLREALIPVWRQNWFLLPAFFLSGAVASICWWCSRSNERLHT
jgi:hypothetical protein